MGRRGYRAGDIYSRFHSRREGTAWLYDTIREDFVEDPGIPEELWPEIVFHIPSRRCRPRPESRGGRVVYWLFDKGGFCVVFLLLLIVVPIAAWMMGFR